MTRLVERLAAHVEAMKRNIDPSTVSRFMSLLRQVIEETETKHRYPILNLFCDWSLHPKLDRKDAQNILAAIEEALLEEMEKPGHFTADTFTVTVSPRRLRDEMIALLTANTIDPAIADNPHHFVAMAACLTEDISHKPLELTEKRLKEKTDKPITVGKQAHVVRALTIEPNTNPEVKAKYMIKADIVRLPLTPQVQRIYIQAPFVIATDEKGNPVA
jgi:hypothetical protein